MSGKEYVIPGQKLVEIEEALTHAFQHYIFLEEEASPQYCEGYRKDATVKLLQNHIAILDNKDDAMEMLGFDSTSYCSACLIQSLDWEEISSAYSELEQ